MELTAFDRAGKVLFHDQEQGLTIHAGNVFEAPTVKGGTNLIIALRVSDGHMFYAHGDKVRKVKIDTFVQSILHGDLQPRSASEIDTGRLSMAIIGLEAMSNRRTGEEHINYLGEGAEERFLKGE